MILDHFKKVFQGLPRIQDDNFILRICKNLKDFLRLMVISIFEEKIVPDPKKKSDPRKKNRFF
jgi:hypothetical protein